jgi:hypothetical protein
MLKGGLIIIIGTFCTCADSFYDFCFLIDEKIKLNPKAANLKPKMLTGSRL